MSKPLVRTADEVVDPTRRDRVALWYRERPRLKRIIDFLAIFGTIIPALYTVKVITSGVVVLIWALLNLGYILFNRLVTGSELRSARNNATRITNTLDYVLDSAVSSTEERRQALFAIAQAINTDVRIAITGHKLHANLYVGIYAPSDDRRVLARVAQCGTTGARHPKEISYNTNRASWQAYDDRRWICLPDTTHNRAYAPDEKVRSTLAIPIIPPSHPEPSAILVIGADQPHIITEKLSALELVPQSQVYLRLIALVMIIDKHESS